MSAVYGLQGGGGELRVSRRPSQKRKQEPVSTADTTGSQATAVRLTNSQSCRFSSITSKLWIKTGKVQKRPFHFICQVHSSIQNSGNPLEGPLYHCPRKCSALSLLCRLPTHLSCLMQKLCDGSFSFSKIFGTTNQISRNKIHSRLLSLLGTHSQSQSNLKTKPSRTNEFGLWLRA